MAADESTLIAPSYAAELSLAMYDVPTDGSNYPVSYPSAHNYTMDYSPESTPPPFDVSAPGWMAMRDADSLESRANSLFEQFINVDAVL